jgi:hypothetical protein
MRRRLGELANHTASEPPPTPLLSDGQLAEFARTGRLVLPLADELGPEIHRKLERKLLAKHDATEQTGQYEGNNIYPLVPELRTILEAPSVVGALGSIHGDDYVLHAHRALQISKEDQTHHQEMTDGHGPMRAHRPHWSMLLYYPAGCSEDMGPTAILEGEGSSSHYYQVSRRR